MFVPREVISDNNPQEFITRYSFNDYTIKLNRCYNSGLILQKIDDHILTFFLIKPHVTYGSVGVNICGDKWKVARRTSRNRFKYRGVINVFNPISACRSLKEVSLSVGASPYRPLFAIIGSTPPGAV